jgi:dimethylaniline monooxygenase (N-oxide forming)
MTVAIIGAGPSGLAAAKEMLRRDLNPVVFESAEVLGGLWVPGRPPMWEGMRTNISRFTNVFSDYPHGPGSPLFLNVPQMHAYLRGYASEFGVTESIQFRTKVLSAVPERSGWTLILDENGTRREFVAEKLVATSGFFSRPAHDRPDFLAGFSGRIIHSGEYRSREEFRGQRVAVLGNSFSGVEIAADLAEVTESTIHYFRRPAWIVPRYVSDPTFGPFTPIDLASLRRPARSDGPPLTEAQINRKRNEAFATRSVQNRLGEPLLMIDPESEEFHPIAISDDYCRLVGEKKIFLRAASELPEAATTTPQPFDAIIIATGYRFGLPYFGAEVTKLLDFDPEDPFQPTIAYRTMYRRELPDLALVGAYKGPYFGIMELQARLAGRIFERGEFAIDEERYENGIAEERRIRDHRPRKQFPHADVIGFGDQLAKDVGCLPGLGHPEPIAQLLREGPVIPAHYRVNGQFENTEVAYAAISEAGSARFPEEESR